MPSPPAVPQLRYHPMVWVLVLVGILARLVACLAVCALGYAVGGAWLPVVSWSFVEYGARHPVSSPVLTALTAVVATVIAGFWFAPVFASDRARRGTLLTPTIAPDLLKTFQATLRQAGVKPGLKIELVPNASIVMAPVGNANAPDTLYLGIAALPELTVSELKGIVASEAARWGGRGYRVGGWLVRITEELEALGHAYGAGGCIQWINPLYWLVAGLSQGLQHPKLLKQVAYQRPLFADAFGVSSAGGPVYASARTKLATNEALFESIAYSVVFELMEEGKQLKNLFAFYRERKAAVDPAQMQKLRETVLADTSGLTSPGGAEETSGLIYPSLLQRLNRALLFPAHEETDDRPATVLLPDYEEYEEKLTTELVTGLDRALQTAKQEMWQEQQRDIEMLKNEYENRK